jgi:hypothetical protein
MMEDVFWYLFCIDLSGASEHLTVMIRELSMERGRPVLDGLYQQLLKRGVEYFLPSSDLEIVGVARESRPQIVFGPLDDGLNFEWLGNKYALTNRRELSDHEKRMLRSIRM